MFEPSTQYFGAPLDGDAAVLDAIDAHLAQLKADSSSVYFASLRRLTETQRKQRLPVWVAWAAAATLAVVAVGLAWIRTLGRAADRIGVAERSQRRMAEDLARVTEHSPDVIAVLDESLNIRRISQAAERLWGYRRCELEGGSCLRVVPEHLREGSRAALAEVIASGGVRRTESVAIRKDGTEARMHWSLVWSPQARELYAIGRDDTERKELIRRLHARGAELARANTDLRTFAQTVSHDLRAPVAAVVGFVGKVLKDDGDALPDRSRQLLTRAHAASQRMDTIIANLLRLARVTEGGVHRRACDVSAMCLDVVTALRNDDPGRHVQVDIQPGMHANADRDLLRHVFDNLLGNAWKFTSRKPGAHIAVACEESMQGRVYFVRDDGAGFDMEYAHNLFLPFSRLHSESQFEGIGIGLCVAHRVVAAHGGKIWANGAPGAGATFSFTLEQPRVKQAADVLEPPFSITNHVEIDFAP
jgi:PAS domain S-box-containing protein